MTQKYKKGDFVVVHSEWECRFAKGRIVSIDDKHLTVKCMDGRTTTFNKANDSSLSIVHSDQFPRKLKLKKMFEVWSKGGMHLETSNLKECFAYIKENFGNSYEKSIDAFLSDFEIKVKHVVCVAKSKKARKRS